MNRQHAAVCVGLLFALICAKGGGADPQAEPPRQQPNRSLVAQQRPAREVWIALRAEGQAGSGTAADPFDGSSPEKLNALFARFLEEFGPNLVIRFGPGIFYGDRAWRIASNWQVRGAGMDVTFFKTRPDPEGCRTVGFYAACPPTSPWVSGFELSDCTFDFNVPGLRKATHAFIYFEGSQPRLYYTRPDNPPAWEAAREYPRGFLVRHAGALFVALVPTPGQPPEQGRGWSIAQPIAPAPHAAWDARRAYAIGDAVVHADRTWLCLRDGAGLEPGVVPDAWLAPDPAAPDPMLLTSAVDVWSGYGGGGNIVRRVKMINGHGSAFYGREAFLVKVGGDDCVIEDCHVDLFRGDYSTCLVVFGGHNNVIRGCTVRGDGSEMMFAYGGWENLDNVFENNFAYGVRTVTNIDSLRSRNVIFRHNVFMHCRAAGIHINVGNGNAMDGLFIHDNLVEMCDDAPHAAIQLGHNGLSNVRIWNNVLRTVSGTAPAKSIFVAPNARRITIRGNTCEPAMLAQVPMHAHCWDNYDLTGQPMQGLPLRAREGQPPPLGPLQPAADPQPPPAMAEPTEHTLGPEGAIMQWLVLGPFPHPPEPQPDDTTLGGGYAFDFLTALGGEVGARPSAGASVVIRFPGGPNAGIFWPAARQLPQRRAWQRAAADRYGYVDALTLPGFAEAADYTCLYAFVTLRSEQEQPVILRVGSDDGFVLFFDGGRAAEVRDDRRNYRRDQDAIAVRLRAGENPLLLKVANYLGGFGWSCRVTTPDGAPAAGVRVVLP